MQYVVRAERVAGMPIFVVSRRVRSAQLSKVVPEACGAVWNVVKAAGVKGAGRHVAVYRGCADGQLDVEVGVEVPSPVGRQGEVFDSSTPAGEVATVTHLGPYSRLGEAHDAIHAWCAANGRTPDGTTWEVYGHWLPAWNENPSQIRTDVFHLLRP